jgi:predicted membrane protein
MRNQSRVILGLAIIGVGLLFLIGVIFPINVWRFCWPVGLIVVGAWLLLRPSLAGPGVKVRVHPLGDVRRSEAWDVGDEEIWIGAGDVHLDLTAASLAPGESTIRVFGLVGDVALTVPEGMAVSVSSYAILTDGRVYGEKRESFFAPVRVESDGYSAAAARVRLESFLLVSNFKVERP